MKYIFTEKELMYNLRTSNLLTLPKINTKRFGLLVFVPVTYGISYQTIQKKKQEKRLNYKLVLN